MKKLPAAHWNIAYARSLVGECLVEQKKFEEAERLLIDGHKTLRANADTPPARLADARGRVRKLYTAWGKPDEAKKW